MPHRDTEQFEAHRPLMFSIAYRMVGSATDAEDIVQQAYLRYQSAEGDITSHKAYLSTIVTRLCLNHLQLARTQRESYIGEWLPEPVLTDADEHFTPTKQVELHESLSIAFLTLLEQLTPLERAVFLLREVFDYDYREIAKMVGKEEAACRQILSRAKKHVAEHRPRFKPSPEAHREILDRFIQTAQNGNLDALLELLADDVVMWADGGGKVRGTILKPLYGREAVARFVMGSQKLNLQDATETGVMDVNGEPAFVIRAGTETRLVIALSVDDGQISAIRVIGNPDKLRGMNRAAGHNPEVSQ